ncbi:MAG: hypothetical protein JWL73_3428 [Actinomycetia bacterium]|nr:hypothetical protein [Actinomycetes bacterium]
MPLILAGIAFLFVIGALAYLMAKDRGPGPEDAAMAYELAWDRLDFETLWTLSGIELQDNLERKEFLQAKREAYRGRQQLERLARGVTIVSTTDDKDVATVVTEIALNDGHAVRDELLLARRDGRWKVTRYTLAREGEPAPEA